MGACFSSDVRGGQQAVGGADPHRQRGGGGGNGGNDADAAEAVDLMLRSRGYYGVSSQIELSFSASKLRDRDVLSKSDPMAVIYSKKRDGTMEEIGRTEVILNSLDPRWITKLTILYQFEVVQTLVFHVYDVDTHFHNVPVKMLKLDEQQFLGEASCTLSEIVSKSSRSVILNLNRKDHAGEAHLSKLGNLTVHADEASSSRNFVEMVLRCSDLENKDMFSKSDPFLVLSRTTDSGMPVPIFKTEVIRNNLNPCWKPVVLNLQQAGSKDKHLTIECFDFNGSGKHDLIGKLEKSLADLELLCENKQGENLFIPSALAHGTHTKVLKSKLYVDKFSEYSRKTFLDYVAGGCELNFMVAIDFTASNGNSRLPDSLHYMDPSGRPNEYQRAILEVGEVLQFYDTDKKFPAWGFGGRPIDGPVSHCFNLNGSTQFSEVDGIQGIMTAYSSALRNVSLAGPTLFGPVINTASLIASQSLAQSQVKYFVLLIITDGVITDIEETKDSLVKASDLPLSILIVGVGGADFKDMEILDADKGNRLESSTGRIASRDIVQFVPMREVQGRDVSVVQSLLAELPLQFLSYMEKRQL